MENFGNLKNESKKYWIPKNTLKTFVHHNLKT
jgi:hypothetical protein